MGWLKRICATASHKSQIRPTLSDELNKKVRQRRTHSQISADSLIRYLLNLHQSL